MVLSRKIFGVTPLFVLLATGALGTCMPSQAKQSTSELSALKTPLGCNIISTVDKLVTKQPGARPQPQLLCVRSEQNATEVNSVKANGTQLKYWIELDRDGKKLHVTNQETFRTGDKIKFHLQASSDGFLYIVLRTGSRGEQEILFPHPKLKDDNHIVKNVDYVLPADDYLLFDEFPGTEKLVLMFSRQPIELKQAMASKNRVVLRGGAGSKDLVPASTSVSYTSDAATPPSPETQARATAQATMSTAVSGAGTATARVAASATGGAGATVTASTDAAFAQASSAAKKTAPDLLEANQSSRASQPQAAGAGEKVQQTHGDVIVQHDDPSQVLTVDIDLVHK